MATLFDVGVVKSNFFRNLMFSSTFSFMINTLVFYETALDPERHMFGSYTDCFWIRFANLFIAQSSRIFPFIDTRL